MNVSFQSESFTGVVQVGKTPSGLNKKEVLIDICISNDNNGEFQTLKQINMNLSQFVDTGKIDDVISF